MHIIVSTTSGDIVSDTLSKVELVDLLGSEAAAESEVKKIQRMFEKWSELETVTIWVNGRERYINPTHIVWVEVHP